MDDKPTLYKIMVGEVTDVEPGEMFWPVAIVFVLVGVVELWRWLFG